MVILGFTKFVRCTSNSADAQSKTSQPLLFHLELHNLPSFSFFTRPTPMAPTTWTCHCLPNQTTISFQTHAPPMARGHDWKIFHFGCHLLFLSFSFTSSFRWNFLLVGLKVYHHLSSSFQWFQTKEVTWFIEF